MNRLLVSFFAVFSAAACCAAAEKFDACALLTGREIEAVQGDRLASTKSSQPQRARFAVAQCFYTMATFSKSISLEVTRHKAGEAEGPRVYWKQMFARAFGKQKEREKESGEREERAAAPPRRIEGVGDEAYWDASAIGGGLYVLSGDAYFRLSVGGPDTEAVKLEKLKKLARQALRRLR